MDLEKLLCIVFILFLFFKHCIYGRVLATETGIRTGTGTGHGTGHNRMDGDEAFETKI